MYFKGYFYKESGWPCLGNCGSEQKLVR